MTKSELDSHVSAYQGNNVYDFDNQLMMSWYSKRVVEKTDRAESLLELGLGHGITTEIFSKNFKRHVALDGSFEVIQRFSKLYPNCNAEIIETYFEEFTTEEKFDVIIMGFVLEHVSCPIEIMRQFKKFLSAKGRVFVAVPNAEALNRRLGNIGGLLPELTKLSEHDLLLGHKRYYTVDTLTSDIEKSGYSMKSLEGVYLKPITTNQILQLNLDDRMIQALCVVGKDYPELCCGLLAEITVDS